MNELPLKVDYLTEFLDVAYFLYFNDNTNIHFNDEHSVLLFTKIRSVACQGYWKVPVCDIEDYEILNSPLPRAHLFGVVSHSDINMLNRALLLPAGDYLEAENCVDKFFLLAIAMRNNFTKGVAALQEAFNITQEECQELTGNMKFPLTENLLIAAIHRVSPLELDPYWPKS